MSSSEAPATGGNAAVITGSAGSSAGTSFGAGAASAGAASAGAASAGTASAGAASTGTASGGGMNSCLDKPGALRGKSSQTLKVGALSRTFVHYAPANLNPNEPAPIVIVAHGWLQSAQVMFDLTQYQKVADREGFVLMYPDGEPGSFGPWNVGDGACPSKLLVLPTAAGDDQAFIDAMLAFAEADQCLDRRHVFVTGFSMGGYFTNETGCLRSNVAAIGPHSGGSHSLSSCPAVHKPVIVFHGTGDGLIPVECGVEARDRWAQHNGCDSAIESVSVMGGRCEYSKGCPADGQVALCLFDGMDHGWAGGQGNQGFPAYESASELGWAFFKKHGW